ncbi:hypothetical protein AM493_03400 [Flavobacterium akiainvivens]|uniref:Uncharacterized protein n=1 Tax=Flavobacterium akiainvivens TaxID=1202724 RepID=A0A0M9VK56_9FLAO|nr:hypothetical protein [Flavobacterium akiainvivens]KOS08182.1 hypothetical protein AM493_03400 [Flavobacterium akiainvivens]
MAPKTLKPITGCLAISIAFLYSVSVAACGWGDTDETLRLAFFRAEAPGMAKFSPFYYSDHYFNQYEIYSTADRWRNCREWQQKLGDAVVLEHIYELQYNTVPERFQLAYQSGTLKTEFKGNTFIKALLLPKNKGLLEYFEFAKQMEYFQNPHNSKWESWDDSGEERYWDREQDFAEQGQKSAATILAQVAKKLPQVKDAFLQQRYAFMLIRYGETAKVPALYDRYFTNSNTILQNWALLFKAYATQDKAEQNYYLSRVFDLCEEKVIAVMQWFNINETERTLAYTKNDHEKAVILPIAAMRNPGRALDQIERINRLWPQSVYVNMLVGREINKLEDWIFSPKMLTSGPDIYSEYVYEKEYARARRQNLKNDLAYLARLKGFVKNVYPQTQSATKDYLLSCLSHLSFMDDSIADGYRYANAISNNAPASVKVQKSVELALVAAKQGKLSDVAVQQKLYEAIQQLWANTEADEAKSLYTFLKVLSSEYNKAGDMATAGLLFLKADNYKYYYGYYSDGLSVENQPANYSHIAYFDRLATLKDIDNLVDIISDKNKSPFYTFISNGVTTDVNFYLDLKGTIAFRQNKLKEAFEIFKAIPKSYYKEQDPYSGYYTSDPYYPSVLDYALTEVERKVVYDFDKAEFVKQLIGLQEKTDAESYLKLGHAYYNLSYAGSYWKMISYYQGYMYYDAYFGHMAKLKETFQSGNYANLTLAKYWYNKAYKKAKNKEQKAMAALMLHVCTKHSNFSFHRHWWDNKPRNLSSDKWVGAFYSTYKKTGTFKKFSCPEMEMYLK